MVVFIHIPKTAGKTLTRIIQRNNSGEGISVYYNIKDKKDIPILLNKLLSDKVKVKYGHVSLADYLQSPQHTNNEKFCTLLRKPEARSISNFFYMASNKNHPMYEYMQSNGINLQNHFERMAFHFPFDNMQVRFLSGAFHKPYGCVDNSDLEEAKKNLREKMAVFGFVEDFDAFALLVRKHLGWKNILYLHTNKNKSYKSQRELQYTSEELQAVKHNNLLDIELYNFARELYEEKFKVSYVELKVFKSANKLYTFFKKIFK